MAGNIILNIDKIPYVESVIQNLQSIEMLEDVTFITDAALKDKDEIICLSNATSLIKIMQQLSKVGVIKRFEIRKVQNNSAISLSDNDTQLSAVEAIRLFLRNRCFQELCIKGKLMMTSILLAGQPKMRPS